MSKRPFYLGIDLGTTNSAAAVFDGERITVVRNAQGGLLTPSIVRLDGKGTATVGARAARFLDSDPRNTRSEFKRLMGTATALDFPAAKAGRLPEELAAEVLRSLRNDVKEQLGVLPEQAVISVPALFELPQSSATTKAAQLAGFTRVELIQEPIASALAAGWTASEGTGYWLVYDLGGGTFDASLLETRDGLLRVVGHDGDNFLGGRDFDWAIVDWAIGELNRQHGLNVSRAEPRYAAAMRKLKLAAEEAKIELTRAETTELFVSELLEHDGAPLDLQLTLGRAQLDLWSRGLRVFNESRARHNPDQFLDIDFADLRGDPMGTVERVYSALDTPMSDAARAGVLALDEESKTGARAPSHTYSLADYGLDADDVTRAFGD